MLEQQESVISHSWAVLMTLPIDILDHILLW